MVNEIKKKTAKLAYKKGYNISSEKVLYKVIATNTECIWNCRSIGDGGGVYEFIAYLPTQTELQTWLREEHKIHIEIFLDDNSPYTGFYYRVMTIGQYFAISHDGIMYKKYEKALEIGLKEALKLIKIDE